MSSTRTPAYRIEIDLASSAAYTGFAWDTGRLGTPTPFALRQFVALILDIDDLEAFREARVVRQSTGAVVASITSAAA